MTVRVSPADMTLLPLLILLQVGCLLGKIQAEPVSRSPILDSSSPAEEQPSFVPTIPPPSIYPSVAPTPDPAPETECPTPRVPTTPDYCPLAIAQSCYCPEMEFVDISTEDTQTLVNLLHESRTSAAAGELDDAITAMNDYREAVNETSLHSDIKNRMHFFGREEFFGVLASHFYLTGTDFASLGIVTIASVPAGTYFQTWSELHPAANLADDEVSMLDLQFSSLLQDADEQVLEKFKKMLCDAVEKMEADDVEKDVLEAAQDLKKVASSDQFITFLESIMAIAGGNGIDATNLQKLEELKELLLTMANEVKQDSDLGQLLTFVHDIICVVVKLFDCGLERISGSKETGKYKIKIDVSEALEIPLLSREVDTESWYGKTTITIYLNIKESVTVTFCPDQMKINFEPGNAVDINVDSSGIFVVSYLESLFGFDLDRLCLECIETLDGGKTKITGNAVSSIQRRRTPRRGRGSRRQSMRSKICITTSRGFRGATVKVGDKITYPKKKNRRALVTNLLNNGQGQCFLQNLCDAAMCVSLARDGQGDGMHTVRRHCPVGECK